MTAHPATLATIQSANEALNGAPLYRYRALDAQNANQVAWLQETLEKNLIYFPTPLQLNDPWECRPLFKVSHASGSLERTRRERSARRALERRGVTDRQERKRRASQLVANPAQLTENLNEELKQFAQKYGVYSLTPHCDSVLMWSYYASSHAGVCLEFASNVAPFSTSSDIHYSDALPILDLYMPDRVSLLRQLLFTKASCWRHEDEFRFVMRYPWSGPETPPLQAVAERKYALPQGTLVGIVLGCNMRADNREKIMGWAKGRSASFRVRQAIRNKAKYALDFVDA